MTGIASPDTYIKHEPDDFTFNNFNNHNMSEQYGSWHGNGGNVDPSQLNNTSNQQSFNAQNNMSGSFIQGSSAITDDDLLGSLDSGDHYRPDDFTQANHFNNGGNGNNFPQMHGTQPQSFNQIYSHTPEGAPIRSPFASNNFDYNGWSSMRQGNQMRPSSSNNPATNALRTQMQQHNGSISRSPITPLTPNMGNMNVGTPDSNTVAGRQAMPAPAHRRSASQQWDNSLDGGYSYMGSPLSSPGGAQHAQISEVLKARNSVPPASYSASAGASKVRSLEDKKAKRRASHNEVERKRRNNINNQITTLSRLVPPHRLEDDNIRRALSASQTLPAHLTGAGITPPNSSSLLSGSGSRRGVGSITQGLPIEEKDKAPAKGDVLNSSVGWMRDLMWLVQRMMHRESILQESIESLGGQMPVDITDDENRMRTEVLDALQRNEVEAFEYSRKHGSGLWVPNHTDPTGQPLNISPEDQHQPPSANGAEGTHFWGYEGENGHMRPSMELKEEDEYGSIVMDME